MATSEVEVANSALRKIGAERIDSLDEGNKRARLCKDALPLLRQEVIRSHPWNFAIDRIALAKLTTTPVGGFDFEYAIPANVLRILHISDGTVGDTIFHSNRVSIHAWSKEAGVLRADIDPIVATVLLDITTVAKWDANFVEVLALRLAADLAYSIVQSTTLQTNMLATYQRFLATARSFDAQEGSVRQVSASEWLDTRS